MFACKPPKVSFEFFPPKNKNMEAGLWSCVDSLKGLNPSFVSVTYGAGGSTRKRTHSIVSDLQQNYNLPTAAHLTCVGSTKQDIEDIAQSYWNAGIKHIVALRGDLPDDHDHSRDAYAYASDLVTALKNIADFDISVAGYPETHPECASAAQDIENLKRKIDCGANRVITQFFMNPDDFLRWRDKANAAGVSVPIVPGILPINHFGRATRFAKMCGTNIPKWMKEMFEGLDSKPTMRDRVAVSVAHEQCRILQVEGVNDFHFYTLNRSELAKAVCHLMGVRS